MAYSKPSAAPVCADHSVAPDPSRTPPHPHASDDRTGWEVAPSSAVLSDADMAVVSDLAARRRATTTVADLDAAHRADIVTRYYAARGVGDWDGELAALAEASRYDAAHEGEDLTVELCAGEQVAA